MTSFHSFPLSLFHLESTLLGMKDLLFILLGFPRHASLRHRIRTTFGVHTSFFPSSHLRVSRTPRILKLTWRILSHRYAVPRDKTTCACFHLQRKLSEELSWDLFIGHEFLRKIVIKYRIPSFPCNITIIKFVFASDVLAILQSSSRVVYFFSEKFRSMMLIWCNKEWLFSRHVSWTLCSIWWQ